VRFNGLFERIPQSDKEILRDLGRQIYEIATSPVNEEYVELQKNINNLKMVKLVVHIYEIPWHEMDVHGELRLRTKHPPCRRYEEKLRRIIYKWNHKLGTRPSSFIKAYLFAILLALLSSFTYVSSLWTMTEIPSTYYSFRAVFGY
jgi:hypothetical protein